MSVHLKRHFPKHVRQAGKRCRRPGLKSVRPKLPGARPERVTPADPWPGHALRSSPSDFPEKG